MINRGKLVPEDLIQFLPDCTWYGGTLRNRNQRPNLNLTNIAEYFIPCYLVNLLAAKTSVVLCSRVVDIDIRGGFWSTTISLMNGPSSGRPIIM